MRTIVNVASLVLLGLLAIARRSFTKLLETPKEERRAQYTGMRALLWAFGASTAVFAAVSLWSLARGGYLPAAALLAFVLGSLAHAAWRRSAVRGSG